MRESFWIYAKCVTCTQKDRDEASRGRFSGPLLKEETDLNYTPSRDKIEVTLFNNFFCPVGAYMYQLTKKVAQSFGDEVRIVEAEATVETMRRYGTTDPLINGKVKILGPASEENVKRAIQEEIDQIQVVEQHKA